MDYPKLRPLNAFPVESEGQTYVCLQDPKNISERSLVLAPPTYYIVSLFNGKRSLLDIQADYMRQFGEFLYTEKLQEVIAQLDENLFLESERFEKAEKEIEDRFRLATVREAAFAGKSYEADPERLKIQLRDYFEGAGGPGRLEGRKESDGSKMRLVGIVAPHIDLKRGGPCYAFSHQELWRKTRARCFIILGISHAEMEFPFSLTRKDFLTPLGTLKTDRDLVDAIQSLCPYDPFRDEAAHRTEHSVEFQCLFLRYLYPEPVSLKIVPILCGSFYEIIQKGISPMEHEPYRRFVEALMGALSENGEEVCLIASADLAHQGPQFGDREGMGEYDLRMLEEKDREMLRFAEKMDAEGFYSFVLEEKDRRKICGLSAVYTLLKVLEAKDGNLLRYDQAFTPETQSVVSFASLAFYR